MLSASKGVNDSLGKRIIAQGVNCKVAPAQIQLQAAGIGDVIGVPPVTVRAVAPHGGHFQGHTFQKDRYCSKSSACGQGMGKQSFDLIRLSIGSDIPVCGS